MAASLSDVAAATTITNVDATSFSTPSFTPTANKPLYVFVYGIGSSNTPSISTTTGLTFTERAAQAQGTRKITLFSAPGVASPSNGTITVDYGATQSSHSFIVLEGTDVDESSTVGDGIEQVKTATNFTGTTATVTLNSAVTAGNITAGSVGIAQSVGITPGTDFSELKDHNTTTTSLAHQAEQWTSPSDATIDMTFSNGNWALIGMEIKSAAGGGGTAVKDIIGMGLIPFAR